MTKVQILWRIKGLCATDLGLEKKPSFRQQEKRLQSLIEQLENRLRKTDQATVEAKEIREELQKLKGKK